MKYNFVVEKDVCKVQINLTLKQFEVLNDVLSEIEECRVYEDEDGEPLEKLQEIFSYSNYIKLEERMEGWYELHL